MTGKRSMLLALCVAQLYCATAQNHATSTALPPGQSDWQRAGRTMNDVTTLAVAMEAYAVENQHYPDARQLKSLLSPYLPTVPLADAWGTPFRISVANDGYSIVSAGSDRRFRPEAWTTEGEFADLTEDLVYSNGRFVRRWPLAAITEERERKAREPK